MRVTVLGAGAWGTALAKLAAENEHQVTLWARDATLLESIVGDRENERYLAGVALPKSLQADADLQSACCDAEILVVAVPSKGFRDVLRQVGDFVGSVVTVTKGIEYDSGLTMSGLLEAELKAAVPVTLSGPTIAREVAMGMPAAGVAASNDTNAVFQVQQLFHRPTFRVYSSTDVLGVELGGALKNVIAIAAGVGDGLGFGDNSKAALLTRGVAEIRRLGVAAGAKAETFTGLSGLGDLTVTCFSPLSRNRTFGEHLGRGGDAGEILAASRSVVEGAPTSRSAHQLARRLGVRTPIIDEVYAMLHQGKLVKAALQSLLSRETKYED
ncbi:MAG: Glycerol-3-phosphate dehydrogenase [NAD(P)+] [Verrucomicrobia subdivision 3 bacterium]|nr:Glycerol-3-phosphate dehydrogenase [NAD(P)+] [Limisphaerales bacterium]MCS1414333.1 Glycerol-3-phosphate dehydrogenase [NAD(P)+] [Limisphaerales bacterium]